MRSFVCVNSSDEMPIVNANYDDVVSTSTYKKPVEMQIRERSNGRVASRVVAIP